MGILIKGMEMPKNCLICPFHGFGGYKNELIVCSLTGRSEGQLSNVLGCPLVEVPFPHGRLIDADNFIKRLSLCKRWAEEDDFALGVAWYETFIRHIELTPTIIEAEEGEKA